MDEPTTGLDPETRFQIWQTIRRLGRGRLLILSTHSMEEAEALSTRIGIMNAGRMLCLGDPVHLKVRRAKRRIAANTGDSLRSSLNPF